MGGGGDKDRTQETAEIEPTILAAPLIFQGRFLGLEQVSVSNLVYTYRIYSIKRCPGRNATDGSKN